MSGGEPQYFCSQNHEGSHVDQVCSVLSAIYIKLCTNIYIYIFNPLLLKFILLGTEGVHLSDCLLGIKASFIMSVNFSI